MAAVSGLASPGAPSSPALVSPYVAITYSYLPGLTAPDLSSQVTGPTTVWMYDGQEWRPASYIHNHDRAYAPIARGVTNGDYHNHGSGDGAPIHYATLLGRPTIPDTPAGVGLGNVTNDAQVKRSEMGMPGGVSTLDGNGLVDGWISDATSSVKGKVRLATDVETLAGTDATKAVTPAGLAAVAADRGWGEDFDNFYTLNNYGDITFSLAPTHSKNFMLNSYGDITFKE